MKNNYLIKERADFLSGIVMRRYPFRPSWTVCARRMLVWGMSCHQILGVFDKVYSMPIPPVRPMPEPSLFRVFVWKVRKNLDIRRHLVHLQGLFS